MAGEVGDAQLNRIYLYVSEPAFEGVAATPWVELEEKGLTTARAVNGAEQYHLTAYGWLKCLELTGMFDNSAFRAKCA